MSPVLPACTYPAAMVSWYRSVERACMAALLLLLGRRFLDIGGGLQQVVAGLLIELVNRRLVLALGEVVVALLRNLDLLDELAVFGGDADLNVRRSEAGVDELRRGEVPQ